MRYILFFLIGLLTFAGNTHAKDQIDLNGFMSLPVQFDGRLMPLDSFGRIHLDQFSGKSEIKGLNHQQWLALSFFKPDQAALLPVFKIKNVQELGLQTKDNNLYSYIDLNEAFSNSQDLIGQIIDRPFEELSSQQQEFLQHYQNFLLYGQILRSFTALLPLAMNDQTITLFDVDEDAIQNQSRDIFDRKGQDFDSYTTEEQNIIDQYYQMAVLKKAAENNIIVRVIPEGEDYKTVWQTFFSGQRDLIQPWQDLATAYGNGDNETFQTTVSALQKDIPVSVKLEKIYTTIEFIPISAFLFLVGGVIGLLSLRKNSPIIIQSSIALFALASITLAINILFRVIISERMPLGTLYETILFASLVMAIAVLIYMLFSRNYIMTALTSLACGGLLIVSQFFVGADSFSPLVAVLNTDFWLATHVVIITAGYGLCLITALFAHAVLIKDDLAPKKFITFLAVLSLLFVSVGTVLGGLWADQSWGRFWGWDPKENGALLITLWLTWLLHAKMTDYMNEVLYFAGLAYLTVIVALAWFGVNLLNIGLHSYGFISGVATGLTSFVIIQTMIIAALVFWRVHKQPIVKS
ncbi:MAG: cytochrome c biogenesis protein CcsA [Pseudomonadota bacterium]